MKRSWGSEASIAALADSLRTWTVHASAMLFMLCTFAGVAWLTPLTPLLCATCIACGVLPRLAAATLICFTIEAFLPAPESADAAWPALCAFFRWPLFESWRAYHRYSILSVTRLSATETYLFAAHPHGIFPMSQWLTNPHGGQNPAIQRALPMPIRGCVASILFRFPFLRHVLAWHGLVPASRRVIRRLLVSGTSCVIVPGGVREIFVSSPEREVLVLKDRYGFVRAAMDANVPLVPIYCFGNTSVFHSRPPPPRLRLLARRLRMGIVAFWGRLGLPLPFPVQLTVVIGAPLKAESGESVEQFHSRYVRALRQLFDEYKAVAGAEWALKELIIT